MIDDPHDVYAVPKNMTSPLATKVKYAALAAVPVAFVIGAVLKGKKARAKKDVRISDEASDRPEEACPTKAGICRPGKAIAPQPPGEQLPQRPTKWSR